MARKARMQSPTEYYHIIMRGNNRENIFSQQFQKQYFKDLLKEQIDEGYIAVAGYCIMDNHIHIVIKADIGCLTKAIKSINIKYAMNFNKERERIGHVFQDRFKSEEILDENYLIQVIRYIHNNPIKAKMVKSPEEYKWSSYNEYIGQNTVIDDVQKDLILELNNGISKFICFHKEQDDNEYLEIKEDRDKYRLEKAQELISSYFKEKGINDAKELNKYPEYMEEIIKILLSNTELSHRKVAGLLSISNNIVHSISLERT